MYFVKIDLTFFWKKLHSVSPKKNTLGSSPQIFHLLPKTLILGIGFSRCLQDIKNDNLACPRSVSSSNLLHARLVCFQTGILLVLILPAFLDPSGNWSFLPSSYGLFTFANKANAIHYAASGFFKFLAELIDKQKIQVLFFWKLKLYHILLLFESTKIPYIAIGET